jgi:hypothetical protein
MLEVLRAGVTEVLHILQSRKLIQAGRGEIIIRNRKGLELAAGNAYERPKRNFAGSFRRFRGCLRNAAPDPCRPY